jgi:hypothetical protein
MLSMVSSFRGRRGGSGYIGAPFGIAGLKDEEEGTRACTWTWRAREAAVGLVGDPARMRGAEGMRAILCGLGDGAMGACCEGDREVGHYLKPKLEMRWKATYNAWRLRSVYAGRGGVSLERRWLLLGRWRCNASFSMVEK